MLVRVVASGQKNKLLLTMPPMVLRRKLGVKKGGRFDTLQYYVSL